MTTHPFLKYAIALLMVRNNLQKEEEIDDNHILDELKNGLNHYALKAPKVAAGRNIIKYRFAKKDADFISPSFINKNAKDTIEKLIGNELTKDKLPLVGNPFAGEFSVSVSAMLVYTRQKNIAQVFILERYFFVSIYPAAIPGTYLAVFLVAVLQLC